MRFSCTKSELIDGISTVQRAVTTKNMPVLSCIKLSISDGKLTFSATDLEIGIQTSTPLIDYEEGETLVPAKLLSEIARKLPNQTISCEAKDNKFIITYGKSHVELTTMDPTEFPLLPDAEDEILRIPADELKRNLHKVKIALAAEESRPVFTGLLFNLEHGTLELVGTDTHRLALAEMEIESDVNFRENIPGKAIREIESLEGEIVIRKTGSQIVFESEDTRIITRTLEGQYPPYRQVIPKSWKSRVYVDTKQLLGTVERASILADNGIIRIEDGLRIETQADTGKISEQYETETEGEPIKVSVNAKFLMDALKGVSGEDVYIEFNGASAAMVLREEGYVHIVLPVRTN